MGSTPLSNDPWAFENGLGDIVALLFHVVLWWTVLYLLERQVVGRRRCTLSQTVLKEEKSDRQIEPAEQFPDK